MAKFHTCPGCGKQYDHLAVICVECGVDLRTGEKRQTELGEVEPEPIDPNEPEPMEEFRPSFIARSVAFFLACLPGLQRPSVMIGAVILTLLGLGLVLMGLIMFFTFFLLLSSIMIAGLGVVCYAQAVVWLIMGEWMLIIDGMAEFDSARWNIFVVMLMLPLFVLGVVVKFATRATQGE